jgi:hypothetical protein
MTEDPKSDPDLAIEKTYINDHLVKFIIPPHKHFYGECEVFPPSSKPSLGIAALSPHGIGIVVMNIRLPKNMKMTEDTIVASALHWANIK